MIGKKEFIEAIGKPDAGFCRSVEEALDIVRVRAAREEARRPRRYHMILPVAAAAVIFAVFMGAALRGGFSPRTDGGGSGVMAQPEITMLKKAEETAAAEPDMETPQPTLEAESPYVTEQPLETYPEQTAAVTAEPTPGAEERYAVNASALADEEDAPLHEEAGIFDLYDNEVIDKLISQFDGNLSALYPGYYFGDTSYEQIGDGRECVARWLDNELNGEIAPLWIAVEQTPEFLPEYFTEANAPRDYYTVTIDVPESRDVVAWYNSTADGLDSLIYEGSLERIYMMLGDDVMDGDLMLTGIRFYLDEELKKRYCELYFGGDVQSYLLWEYSENEYGDVSYTLHIDTYGETEFYDPFGDVQQMDVEYGELPDVLVKIGEALGLDRSVGIIGGADGPTQVVVGSAITSAVAMPETYYSLFCDGTGQSINGLWPGAYFAGTVNGVEAARGSEYTCDYWLLSDGNGEFSPAWVTWGEVVETDAGEPVYDCPTLSVVMPDNAELIDAFMMGADQWLYDVYFGSRDLVCEMLGDPSAMYNGWELAGMKLTFDSENSVSMCELFFGEEDMIYLLWTRSGDGFELTNEYVDEGGAFFGEYFGAPGSAGTPGAAAIFQSVFGQPVDALYPGSDGLHIQGDDDYNEAYVKYGADSMIAWSVTRGKLWDTDKYAEGDDFISVNAYMPDDAELTEAFMANAHGWLAELYFEQSRGDTELELSHAIVTLTPEGELYACELIYGADETFYVRWMLNEGGEFDLVESGGSAAP